MRNICLAFAVCALTATAGVSARGDETERVSRTLKLDPGGTLRLKNFSGRVTITASDRSEVVVQAVRHATRDRLDRVKLDIQAEGSDVVLIDANRRERSWFEFSGGNNVVETDLDITVPHRTHLDVSVFSSPVTVEGVEGAHRVHSFSSRLSLNDVAGSIKAHTFSGSVAIREKTWSSDQSIDVDTFSGDVELHVPETASADVTFNSFSGRLNSGMPLTVHGTNGRRLRAELGNGGHGTLKFKTFSGSVRIDR